MREGGARFARFVELATAVDWPSALHRAAVLVRAYRGDAATTIEADSEREQQRAAAAKSTIETMARQAIGCMAPAECSCAICREGTKP